MFGAKLLGTLISAFIAISPISYDWDLWQFPQTRDVVVRWSTYFTVTDLGYKTPVDDMTIGSGLESQEQDAEHYFLISYTHDIQCSEACFLNATANVTPYTDSHYILNSSNRWSGKASDLYPLLSFTVNGSQSASLTFSSASDVQSINISIPRFNNLTFPVTVDFKGVTRDVMIDDIANHTLNASSYLLRLTLNDQNIPDSVMTTYRQYIDNGDYSTAYTYITNYIDQQQITNNTQTNNTVYQNTQTSTTLNNLYQTENNFSTQVETDFNDRMDDINLSPTLPQQYPFIQSANWVTTQFNRLTNNNAFGQVLVFSLVIGLLMALIGRFSA